MADLAGGDQGVVGGGLVSDGDVLVVIMAVEDVDIIGAQAREGVLQCGDDGVVLLVVIGCQAAHLGGQYHLLAGAACREPLAEDALGVAAGAVTDPGGVEVGGVDVGTARLQEGVEHREGGLAVRGPAEGVAAEDEGEGGGDGGGHGDSLGDRRSWLDV